jgi:hypothetical protein
VEGGGGSREAGGDGDDNGKGNGTPSKYKGGCGKKPHMLMKHTIAGTLGIWTSG